jgi:hypothetical protein
VSVVQIKFIRGSMSYYVQSKQRIQLYEAVEIAEKNGHRQEHDISRVASEQPN